MAEEGYSLLASALLAIQHFNGRNPEIVPELAEIEGCNVYFPLDEIIVVNSNRNKDQGLSPLIFNPVPPCAIIGPEDSTVSISRFLRCFV